MLGILSHLKRNISFSSRNENTAILKVAKKLHQLGLFEKIIYGKYNYPDEPYQYKTTIGNYGHGTDFDNQNNATWKALGETVERYLWLRSENFYKKVVRTSYKKLGGKALSPFSFIGFSAQQRQSNPTLHFDENTEFTWVKAFSLIEERYIYCPLQIVSAKFFEQKKESVIRSAITTGLATDPDLTTAVLKGVLEVIERDAFMISYLNQLAPPRIDLEDVAKNNSSIDALLKKFKRYLITPQVLILPTDFKGVFVVFAILRDDTTKGPAIAVGARASFDILSAIKDALSEALAVRTSVKYRSPYEQTLVENQKQQGGFNRRGRLLFWAEKEQKSKLDFMTIGKKLSFAEIERLRAKNPIANTASPKKKLSFLVQQLQEKKYQCCFVELSDRTYRKLGFRSVFVVIPELQPMHLDEKLPYRDGVRLYSVPKALGYSPARELNMFPHPFP